MLRRMNTSTPAHPLYVAALEADDNLSVVCKRHNGTRWTADHSIPEAKAAYDAKVAADTAWLDAMRNARKA